MRASLLSLLLITSVLLFLSTRPAAEEPEELVRAELATVGLDRYSGAPVALLREPDSGKVVPIFIGVVEAQAILQGLHHIDSPRPMTHDLLANTIGKLGAELLSIQVHDLRNGTYYGRLLVRQDNGETIEIDTRPSDGLALAVRLDARIEVSNRILRADMDFDFQAPEGSQDVVQAAGITVVSATQELRQEMGLPEDPGVLVSSTRATAREQGLRPGDLIIAVNDRRPNSPLAFLEAIRVTGEGEKANIRFWRDGKEQEIEISTDVPEPDRTERERL